MRNSELKKIALEHTPKVDLLGQSKEAAAIIKDAEAIYQWLTKDTRLPELTPNDRMYGKSQAEIDKFLEDNEERFDK